MVTSDNIPNQIEPKSGPVIERPDPIEGFKDRLTMFCRDAWTGIGHTQRAIAAHRDPDSGFVATVDYGVLDEIDDGPGERSGVPGHGDVVDFGIEGNLTPGRDRQGRH